jgi:hypothetical protein
MCETCAQRATSVGRAPAEAGLPLEFLDLHLHLMNKCQIMQLVD